MVPAVPYFFFFGRFDSLSQDCVRMPGKMVYLQVWIAMPSIFGQKKERLR